MEFTLEFFSNDRYDILKLLCDNQIKVKDDFYDKFNQEAGIYELDKSMKYLQEKLNDAINAIVDDTEVKIEF